MKVLLSIKPKFAQKIFKGEKRFEYRRTIFKNTDVKKVIVYASSPIQMVIGEFEIDKILCDEISDLWKKTKSYAGITKNFFYEYFTKKYTGYAIKIKNCYEYAKPRSLQDEYNIRPPQSFAYIK